MEEDGDKGEGIQNNICLGMLRRVIVNAEGSCCDFCLADSLLLKCFRFYCGLSSGSLTCRHSSSGHVVEGYCGVSLKEASNKTFLSPPDRSAHSASTEDKLDMLIFEAHCELLVNSIINPTHFASLNISREEDMSWKASLAWKQSRTKVILSC